MKHRKMRLRREISRGEKKPQHSEGKATRSIKQMCFTARKHSPDHVCDQLGFVVFIEDISTKEKRGNESVVCTAPQC